VRGGNRGKSNRRFGEIELRCREDTVVFDCGDVDA
jgi:hypothetical protein